MNKMLCAGLVALAAVTSAPASADVVMVPAEDIQGFNVLFNGGVQSANAITGQLNNGPLTEVVFQGLSGSILRASGGQASISGNLDLATNNPNDTLPLLGLTFGLAGGGTFDNAEFNLFGGTATSVNFTVTDDAGAVFTFSETLGNGANRYGFQAIDGQSIRSIAFATVGGGIQDVRQIRLGLTAAAIPEPASWAMMLGGFALLGAASRRRRLPILTLA